MHDKTSLAAREGCRRKLPDACALVDAHGPRRTASRRSIGTARSGAPSAIDSARRCSLLVDSKLRKTSTSARVSTGGGKCSVSSSRSSIAMGT
jgi:hypothetical protein